MKNRHCNYQNPERGFSLMELLVASVVAAAAAALLMGALMPANRSAALRAEQAVSLQLLASQLALLDDRVSAEQPLNGTWEAPLDDHAWTLTLTPLSAPQDALVEATLAVIREDGARLDVVTYRQAPPQP